MKKSFFSVLTVTLLMTLLGACEKDNDIGDDPPSDVNTGDVDPIAAGNQDLSWDLFAEILAENPDENVLISSWSIQTALNMALNGADGNTLDEMLAVLHHNGHSVEEINKMQRDLNIIMREKSGHPELTFANSFFYDDQRLSVKEGFTTSLEDSYNALIATADFNNEEASLNKINGWVKDQTKGKIDQIVDEINEYDLAFLINALYFKSDWSKGFDPDLTRDHSFQLSDGRTVEAPFMTADRNFNFSENQDYQMVDIPFRDSTFSLSLIQKRGSGAKDWAQNLNRGIAAGLYDQLGYSRAMVSFPKFELEFETDLPEVLKKLGMMDAFSEFEANFDRLGQALIGPVIYINQMKHKAVLEIDEKGAEGAAVTSIGFGTTSAPPSFVFDQPFVVVLRHIPTNTQLFTGMIENPVE